MAISGEVYTGCPFCPGKKKREYMYKDLLQHATGVGNGSKKDVRGRAKHLALANYLEKDLAHAPSEVKLPFIFKGPDEMFVYPWCGIIVNIQTELKGGTLVERENGGLKRDLAAGGFNAVQVIHVWNSHGHTRNALVEFGTGLTGFYDAMCFEKAFVASHHGKSDWQETTHHSSGTYGWIARGDECKMPSQIREKLLSKRDLFKIAEIQAGEERKTSLLVADCNRRIDLMDKPPSTEVEYKFNETLKEMLLSLEDAELKKDMNELCKTLKEKVEKLEGIADISKQWETHKRKR